MTSENVDNPYQSPGSAGVTVPWRKWRVWWGASLLLVVSAASLMFVNIAMSAVMVVGALAVADRLRYRIDYGVIILICVVVGAVFRFVAGSVTLYFLGPTTVDKLRQ